MARNFTRSLVKTAATDLSPNPDRWTDEIYQHISRMHPYIMGHLQGDVDWAIEPINEVEGSAAGHVTALIGETPLQIPIVVRDFELKPVDVFLTPQGDMDVLDKEVILRFAADPGLQVGNRIPRHDVLDTGMGVSGSMMGKIASYARFSDDFKRVRGHIQEDYPQLATSFERLAKLASNHRSANFDTLVIEDLGAHFKVAAFDGGHMVQQGHVTRSQAFANLDSKIAHYARKADGAHEIVVERPLDKQALFASGPAKDMRSELKAGDYATVFAGGTERTGKLFYGSRSTINAAGSGDKAEHLVFLADDGDYMVPLQGEVTKGSKPSGEVAATYEGREFDELSAGSWGFIRMSEDGTDTLLGPVRYEGLIRTGYGGSRHTFRSSYQGTFYVSLGSRVTKATPLLGPTGHGMGPSGTTKEYIFPDSTRFVLTKEELIPEEHHSSEAKLAANAVDQNLGVCEMAQGHDGFICKAAGVAHSGLSAPQARGFLMSLGASLASARNAVEKVAEMDGRTLRVYGVENPLNKEAGATTAPVAVQHHVDRLMERWGQHRSAINKLASSLQNLRMNADASGEGEVAPAVDPAQPPGAADVQDTLTAVNLLNPQNATRFSDSRKEMGEAQRVLADLLYKTRIGEAEGLDEEAIREALFGIKSINGGLDEIIAAKG